jgi:hypothetical protein
MRMTFWAAILAMAVVACTVAHADDLGGKVKKAVEHATLDQPGTNPFHLKAVLTPSFERDKDFGRTGAVEIWWASPTRWKRDVRSPEFHQIEVVDGNQHWQKNEGDYFPEWLRETANEIVRPVPHLEEVISHVKAAEAKNFLGRQINIDWVTNTGTAAIHNIQRSTIALDAKTGELLYTFGFGWGGTFKDYQDFHGRRVAHKVTLGSPEVTATIVTLEDLGPIEPTLFDTTGGRWRCSASTNSFAR